MSVNGVDVSAESCSRVREILKESNGDIVLQVVSDPTLYSSVREHLDHSLPTHTVVLNNTEDGHGLHIAAPLYTPGPVFVSAIDEGSPAERCGDIFIGDQIVDIDGIGTTFMTFGTKRERERKRELYRRKYSGCVLRVLT